MQTLAEIISSDDIGIIFNNIHAMFVLVDKDGTLLSWNSAFETCRNAFPSTNKLDDFFLQKDRDVFLAKLKNGAIEHENMEFPFGGRMDMVMCECLFIPLSDERTLLVVDGLKSDGALQESVERLQRRVKLFQVENEHSKKLARNKQIEMEAVLVQANEVTQIDPLTFLPNRRMVIRELQDEILHAERYKSPVTVSVVDVDKFKSVNDTYGHAVGDEVLRQVAHLLRDGIRHPDMAGRYGGEEFLILLPNSDLKAGSEQADRLCKKMREIIVKVDNHEIKVTISIGVAQYRQENDSWDTLLNRADNAMYKAKEKGRNRWEVED